MRTRISVLCLTLSLVCAGTVLPQHARGELHVDVHDAQGASVTGSGELVSELNQFHREFKVSADGRSVVQSLPIGRYYLSLKADGFAEWSGLVEIRSEVPQILV